MPRISPAAPRARVAEEPDGLRIVVPARRQWRALVFLPVWLTGWLVGGGMAVRSALASVGSPAGPNLFLLVWSVAWLFGVAFAVTVLAWNLGGREVIRLSSTTLSTRREVAGLGRTSEFDLAEVRDLRASPVPSPGLWQNRSSSLQFWGLGGGAIAFDYGAKTYRFGDALDEAEAKQLVSRMNARARQRRAWS